MLFESIQRVMCVTSCCLFFVLLDRSFFYVCNFRFLKGKLFCWMLWKSDFTFFIFEFNFTFILLKTLFSEVQCLKILIWDYLLVHFGNTWTLLKIFDWSIFEKVFEILTMMIFDEIMTNESFWSRHLFLCTNIVLLYLQHHAI